MPSTQDSGSSIQAINQKLDEIDHTLEQMLALAELSASDLDVNRAALQKTLERLQKKIDLIADSI